MSASTSAKDFLAALRRGETPPETELRAFAEACAGEFFREIIEPLADSFDPAQSQAYERVMQIWIPKREPFAPAIPARVETVYVLSRVTLGADIKIVSPILNTMKRRFPEARIVFVANKKSAELFAADPRVEPLIADYPRSGSIAGRLEFAEALQTRLNKPSSIVIDPDSRMSQLGLIPLTEPSRYFHFPSRTAGGEAEANLSTLVATWLDKTFGQHAPAYIAPEPAQTTNCAAISLGVGENETKRIPGDFEARLIAAAAARYETIWLDRGAGGLEATRVNAAAETSEAIQKIRFWEGSFAGFASKIAASRLYIGYDSAGQHAAAAARVPLISIFAGAPSPRFRARWTPTGPAPSLVLDAATMAPDVLLRNIESHLNVG